MTKDEQVEMDTERPRQVTLTFSGGQYRRLAELAEGEKVTVTTLLWNHCAGLLVGPAGK